VAFCALSSNPVISQLLKSIGIFPENTSAIKDWNSPVIRKFNRKQNMVNMNAGHFNSYIIYLTRYWRTCRGGGGASAFWLFSANFSAWAKLSWKLNPPDQRASLCGLKTVVSILFFINKKLLSLIKANSSWQFENCFKSTNSLYVRWRQASLKYYVMYQRVWCTLLRFLFLGYFRMIHAECWQTIRKKAFRKKIKIKMCQFE